MSNPKTKVSRNFMIDYLVEQRLGGDIDYILEAAELWFRHSYSKMDNAELIEEYKEYTDA